MNLIRFAVNRPIAVTMIYLVILFTGLVSLSQLPLELMPQVDFPRLTVVTYWYDSAPEMVEMWITAPVEAVSNTIRNVRRVESTSREGQSTVEIEFLSGTNMDFAALELNEKLSQVYESLPVGASHPQIQKNVPKEFQTGDFLSYLVVGTYTPSHLRELALKQIRVPLLGVKGVAEVQVIGGTDRELRIEVDRARLEAFGLDLSAVEQALENLNLRQGVGKIIRQGKCFDLLLAVQANELAELEQVIISNRNDHLIRLADVAPVQLAWQPPRQLVRIQGEPAVMLYIEREVGTNIIEVADRVIARLEQLQKDLPPNVKLFKEQDQSEQIRTELGEISNRAFLCVLVIFLVLLLFLRSLRTPVIILATIFFSVLLTINLFYLAKISLNLITLAGLALGFGMLVDNSIVVVDNIFRLHRQGAAVEVAADQGTRQVALAIIAATLTTVVVFIPFLYMTGDLRIYNLPFAAAVGLSLLASLMVAFSFTPALTKKLLTATTKTLPDHASSGAGEFEPFSHRIGGWLKIHWYESWLKWSLDHRWLIIAVVIVLFVGSYYLFDKYVSKGMVWSWQERTYIRVGIAMPTGSELTDTDRVAREFEAKLVGHTELERIHTRVRREYAWISIHFPEELEMTAVPLVWKEFMINLATQYAGVSVSVSGFGPGFYGGGGRTAPNFRLKVLGYNYSEVKRIVEALGEKLSRNPRVREVNTSSSRWGYPSDLFEMILRPVRESLQKYDLPVQDLLNQVALYLRENVTDRHVTFARESLQLSIKIQEGEQLELEALKNLLINTRSGELLRLQEIAEISQRRVLSEIYREDQQYRRWVTFEFRGPYKLGNKYVEAILKSTHLPPGYKLEKGDFFFMREEEKIQIYWVLAVSILLVYMVTAALFESIRQPFAVILTVPLALIGVFMIFYLTDSSFDRNAYIGVILLGGIVVNNSIILIDQINRHRRNGLELRPAIIQGTTERVRPILMTSFTTIVGLLPLIIFVEDKSSMWYSLALATVGGLLSSVGLVLTVIPVIYSFLVKKY